MRTKVFFIVTFLFVATGIFAQSDWVCYTGSGKLLMSSGQTIEGKVSYCLNSPAKVFVIPTGETKEVKYKTDDVKAFNVEEKHFVSIALKGGAVSVGSNKQFARLLTPDDFKIKLLISETQPTVVTGNDFTITVSYYCQVPGEEDAYALSDMKFTSFKKMTKYVADCPSLVSKIENKEKGYFVSAISTDDIRKEIFTTVASEYQNCAK